MTDSNHASSPALPSNVELLEDAQSYHPSFSFLEADVILRSCDGVLFRVHSFTLRTTCGFFRDMFSLGQDTVARSQSTDIITMMEAAPLVERFLRMICCLETQPWESQTDIKEVLFVAEKYQAAGVLCIVRPFLSTQLFTSTPLELYSLAAHFCWEAEAKLASTLTLSLHINDNLHGDVLRTIPSNYLARLFNLHAQRKRSFRQSLTGFGEPFGDWNRSASDFRCSNSCSSRLSSVNNDKAAVSWRMLQLRMLAEIEERSMGDKLLRDEMMNWEESRTCWAIKCSSCAALIFDKDTIVRRLKTLLDGLPSTV